MRLWDVRRGRACLASLDQHNTATPENGTWLSRTNKAHDGVVNGLEFTADGAYLVSLGYDEKMRVWDLETGMNTLVPDSWSIGLLMIGIVWAVYTESTSDGSDAIYYAS